MQNLTKTKTYLFALLSACLLLNSSIAYAQNVWYAAPAATGNGNGASWANAASLAVILNSLAHAGDEVWVKQGVHTPKFDYAGNVPNPQYVRFSMFIMPDSVQIFGGFSGVETARAQRNWRANTTVLSGDLNGDDGPNFTNRTDNSWHIVLSKNNSKYTTLDGLTISGGNADSNSDGILFFDIGYCWSNDGAGIYGGYSRMTIKNCVIKENAALSSGGGICLRQSNLNISNTEFRDNEAAYGGAISSNSASNSTITNCIFKDNTATENAGALELWYESSPTITNCVFIDNNAVWGGAIGCYQNSLPNITNCTFTGSTAPHGPCVYNDQSQPTIKNCIFWGNDTSSPIIINDNNSLTNISYSITEGATIYTGLDNIQTNPMFRNPQDPDGADDEFMTADDGLQLGTCSFAIDGGTNNVTHTTDILGTNIPALLNVDMGAYENTTYPALPTGVITLNTSTTITTGTSVTFTVNPLNGATPPYQWYINNVAVAGATGASITVDTIRDNMQVYCSLTTNNTCIPSNMINSRTVLMRVCPNSSRFYVKPVASGLGDGSSWANATSDLAHAIANPCGISEIWVAAGVYHPTQDNFGNKNPTKPRNKAFYLQNGTQMYGGFVGNETSLSQRVLSPNGSTTILSGDLNDNDAPNFVNNEDNVYHVLVANKLKNPPILDGFVVTGGNAYDSTATAGSRLFPDSGAGIVCRSSKVSLKNCVFKENTAFIGGAVYTRYSKLDWENCVLIKNKGSNGGAIYSAFDSTKMSNCRITENEAYFGGGIYQALSAIQINQTTIDNNKARGYGGGFFGSGNTGIMDKMVFERNIANQNGGGLYASDEFRIQNSVFTNNKSQLGAAVYSEYSSLKLNTSTFSRNKASLEASGYLNKNSTDTITNCIFWDSTSTTVHEFVDTALLIADTRFCIINDPQIRQGQGNDNRNPNFIDVNNPIGADNIWRTADDGLQLGGCSAAVNTGVSSPTTTHDILGIIRPQQGAVDMGAYESLTASPLPTLSITASPSNEIFAGTTVTFTAIPSTTGTTAPYQWYLNGVPVGTNSTTYTNANLQRNDKISCTATTPFSCMANNKVNSDTVRISICPNGFRFYVKPVASGTGDGSSWANATSDLQAAINNKCGITDIWVAAGTYLPTLDLNNEIPTVPTAKTFYLKDGIKLYGGFAGNETNFSQRNWQNNPTILSGDLLGNDGPDFTNYEDNVEHIIVSLNDSIQGVTIDGFTIKGCNANNNIYRQAEGEYVGTYIGGALFQFKGKITAENNIFEANNSYFSPVALGYNMAGSISNCIFRNNTAYDIGALLIQKNTIAVTNSIFKNNHASNGTGAIKIDRTMSDTISNCVFDNNNSFLYGGAIDIYQSNATNINNSVFIDNKTNYYGSAIDNWESNATAITNNTFLNNRIVDTTYMPDHTVYNYMSDLTITNCIIWSPYSKPVLSDTTNTPNINYCLTHGAPLTAGVGNIATYPMFADTTNLIGADNKWFTADDGLRLMPCSPAVDSATNSNAPLLDALNNPIFHNRKDMGAYESQVLCIVNTESAANSTYFNVFPNPTSDNITIQIETKNETYDLQIINTVGQTVLTKQITENNTLLNTQNLPQGSYFIHIAGKNGKTVGRFVKM